MTNSSDVIWSLSVASHPINDADGQTSTIYIYIYGSRAGSNMQEFVTKYWDLR